MPNTYISLIIITACLLTACAVGPDYVKPKTEQPATFKEGLNWKKAEPKDAVIRSNWWEVFADAELNRLEGQITISNQTVKAAEAQFRQARALVAEARSSYFPFVSGNASQSRGSTSTTGTSNKYVAALDASWELDVWGRIRRTVESSDATAEASAADLASARLSAQAELAIDYLDLRIADEQKRLLDNTATAYTRSLQLTQNLYNAGVQAKSDVLQAKVQLQQTQAQAIDIGVQRAQFEHAIATLVGKAPADFTIAPVNAVPALPEIPISIPSQLLERRPDIAAAERRTAAANAQIGVAEAAFFPDFTLSASGGYQSSSFANWFSLPNRIWSIGPSAVLTLFDAGLRSAQTEAAIATYDQTVANYRQTVLGSFQEVEDNIAALRILEQEADVQEKTVADAHAAVTIFLNQYKAGTVSYLSVVSAQTSELSNQLSALSVRKQRLTAAATLIKALGGSWEATELNKPYVTSPQTTTFSILPPTSTPIPIATPIPENKK